MVGATDAEFQVLARGLLQRWRLAYAAGGAPKLVPAGKPLPLGSPLHRAQADEGPRGGRGSVFLVTEPADRPAVLRCVKNRYGKPADVHLRFEGAYQRFTAGDPLDGYDSAPGVAGRKGKR